MSFPLSYLHDYEYQQIIQAGPRKEIIYGLFFLGVRFPAYDIVLLTSDNIYSTDFSLVKLSRILSSS